MSKFLCLLAAVAAFNLQAFEIERHTNVVHRNGMTLAQKGGLSDADYVVQDIEPYAFSNGVFSVNGETGVVKVTAQKLGAATLRELVNATNGLRRVDDMVVYGDTYEFSDFEYTRIEHDEGTFEIIGQPYKEVDGWYLTYKFDGDQYDVYAPGMDDATNLYFSHIHCSVVAERTKSVVHGPTADRLATTGGVVAVVSPILERRLEEFEGAGDSQIVRGKRESDYWDIFVYYATAALSASYASEANVASTLWPSYWEGTEHPTTLAGYGISQEYLKAFTPETDTTVTYGTTAKATRIGGNSIELYGGSTFVSGTLKPVNDTLFKNPEQVLFQQLGYINLVDLIKQYIQADGSSGVMLTDASFAFTNSDGEVVFAPYVPNSERTTVSTDEGSLVYSVPVELDAVGSGGADYEIGGVRYFRAPDKDVPEKVCLTASFTNSVENAIMDAANALLYSHAIHSYMTGTTNSWFAATNYVFGADAEARTKFAWEEGMDASTVPASMALYEIRDGVKQRVWDQRDWTAWYWTFKAAQMRSEIAASNDAIRVSITNDANNAWAKRYASTGRVNPDPDTTYIDTKAVCLSPGMNWETVATVDGCAYWTIVGNGAVIGGSGTNAVLEIKDFDGNSVFKVTKGEHLLAWLDSSDFVPGGLSRDADGMVCFDMLASVQPQGYFSTTLESADFVAEDSDGCPADFRWESLGGGKWRIHYLLKPGIESRACFAKFQVEVEGRTKVEYGADVEIKGGLIYNGVKIAPVIPSGASAGTTITWKVIN